MADKKKRGETDLGGLLGNLVRKPDPGKRTYNSDPGISQIPAGYTNPDPGMMISPRGFSNPDPGMMVSPPRNSAPNVSAFQSDNAFGASGLPGFTDWWAPKYPRFNSQAWEQALNQMPESQNIENRGGQPPVQNTDEMKARANALVWQYLLQQLPNRQSGMAAKMGYNDIPRSPTNEVPAARAPWFQPTPYRPQPGPQWPADPVQKLTDNMQFPIVPQGY